MIMKSFSPKRIALFGGGGFIGSHLTRRLRDQYELDIVDINSGKITDVLEHPNIEFHELDISDPANDAVCREIVERADVVIDLIAYANPQQYVDMPLEVVDLNYDQNLKLVEACVDADVWLIQFSTCEVYGKVGARTGEDVIFQEDMSDLIMGPVGKHRWIYATAKQLLERMVHAHGLENDLSWTIVRPFNFIGPQMDYIVESPEEGTPRVFASFMSALIHDHPIHLVDGGENKRSFTDIEDAIRGVETILQQPEKFHREIVNIGSPDNEASISEFAHLMRDVYAELSPDTSLPVIRTVSGEEYYGKGYEDIERRVPDVEKLAANGWCPEYNLHETVKRSVSYYVDKYERPGVDASRHLE